MIDLYTLFILTRCHISRRFYSPIDMGYLLGTRGFFSNGFPFTLMTQVFPLSLCTYIHTHTTPLKSTSHISSLCCALSEEEQKVLNWIECAEFSRSKKEFPFTIAVFCVKNVIVWIASEWKKKFFFLFSAHSTVWLNYYWNFAWIRSYSTVHQLCSFKVEKHT